MCDKADVVLCGVNLKGITYNYADVEKLRDPGSDPLVRQGSVQFITPLNRG